MKVLAVIIAHPLRNQTGATNAGRELSVATAKLVDLDLAVMWDRDETDQVDGLPIRYLRSSSPFDAAAPVVPRFVRIQTMGSRIPALVRDGEYDLVHIHNLVPTFAAARVARACRARGIPYVISSHGFHELKDFARLHGFGPVKTALARFGVDRPFRRIVAGAAAIFALSDFDRSLLGELGVGDERIRVVTNGVNEFFLETPRPQEIDAVRQRFDLGPDGAPILYYMGSLHPYKGMDVFLRALGGLRRPFRAVLGGRFDDEKERSALLAGAGLRAEIASTLTFTGGLANEELRALYHLADLFVYPTRADTLPLVVLEAMACGLPVVSTTVGGIPFEVSREAGVLVPPGDPTAVTSAVDALLDDPLRRARLGAGAAARVRAEFRWSRSAERAVEGYRWCLEDRSTAAIRAER